jgi:hypothetical protein
MAFRRIVSVLTVAVAATVLVCGPALGQQDTTPPVLLEFAISPTVFDAGQGPVTVSYCIIARDNLAGLDLTQLIPFPNQPFNEFFRVSFPDGTLEGTVCRQFTVPQFTPYGTYVLLVEIYDAVGNLLQARHPSLGGVPNPPRVVNLCDIGPCELLNRAAGGLPDSDSDGVPDDADNCPTAYNPDQTDRDHDGIGDACDPFPDNPDNDQAQCDTDLGQCHADLAACQSDTALAQCRADLATATTDLAACLTDPLLRDSDADGVPDPLDRCPGTPSGEPVDDAGCSLAQFCGKFDATTRDGARACRRVDWKNDEPLLSSPKDCMVDRGGRGSADDRCVPAQ